MDSLLREDQTNSWNFRGESQCDLGWSVKAGTSDKGRGRFQLAERLEVGCEQGIGGELLMYKGSQDTSHPPPLPGPSCHFPVPTTSGSGTPHMWSGLEATVGLELHPT